jgi:hypothetical protein
MSFDSVKYLSKKKWITALKKLRDKTGVTSWYYRKEPLYVGPTSEQLNEIELLFTKNKINTEGYSPSVDQFYAFKQENLFPKDFYGGGHSKLQDEKILEHWIAFDRLGLDKFSDEDVYVDIAAASFTMGNNITRKEKNQCICN